MTNRNAKFAILLTLVPLWGMQSGCSSTLIFNPSFVNQQTGELFPLAPGDRSGFILVRGRNTTDAPVEFVFTVERRVASPDDPDIFITETETRRVLAAATQTANDMGVLFNCPVNRIGLGENLDNPDTEPGIYLGAQAAGAGGFGIPSGLNPLDVDAGNFDCGDTVIYLAYPQSGVPGGTSVRAYLLDDASQPQVISGLDTFVKARTLIEEQEIEEQ